MRADGRRRRRARLGCVRRRGRAARRRSRSSTTPVNPTGYVFRAQRPRRDRGRARRERRAAALRRGVRRAALRRPARTSRRRRTRSCASGRSSCAASRRRTRWRRGESASPSGRSTRSRRWRATFAWQALAIDGVAQSAALAALDRAARLDRAAPRPELARDAAARDRGRERGRARGRAARGRRVRVGSGRPRRGRLQRAAGARPRDHGAPGPALRRGDAAPADPVRRAAGGARGAARAFSEVRRRSSTGRRAVVRHALARDPDADDAVRGAARVVVRRRVDVALRVEQDEVGTLARRDPAAVGEAEPVGGAGGQPRDRLLDREQPLAEREAAEEPRGRAVEARVRMVAEDAVRADELAAGGRRSPHGRLAPRSGAPSARRARPRAAGARRVATGVAAEVGDRPRAADVRSDAPGRACRGGSPSPAARRRRRARFARASGSREPRERRVRAALLRPARQEAREQRLPAPYGYWSKAIAPRLVEQLEQRLDQPLVGDRLQVREVERRARARATSIISPTASSRPAPSLRTCGTSGAPNAAASSATATSSSVAAYAPGR